MTNVYKWYKIGNFLYKKGYVRLSKIVTMIIRFIFSAYIPSSAMIDEGTKIGYGGLGVVIHARAKIGRKCTVCQGVTIGGTSKKIDVPVIGENVFIGAGAKVLGPITIGDNCFIAANSVVTKSFKNNCLIGGIPAKILKENIDINNYV